MQIKLLNEIVGSIAGKLASEVVDILFGKKNVNEFIIAKKLKLTINQTRNILYKLSDAGLVSFTRKKDKRKGWYTYFWTMNTGKALELLEKKVIEERDGLKNQLKSRENKRYYICITCKVEVSEETALLNNFTCNECGQVYALQTDKKIVNEINSRMVRLDSNLKSIKEELGKIREKDAKKFDKLIKKEAKEKKINRKKKSKALKKEKARALKKEEDKSNSKKKKKTEKVKKNKKRR